MATTLRLPPDLKAEADALAARLGISLNALAAVALRDYLDGRSATVRTVVPPSAPTPRPLAPRPANSLPQPGQSIPEPTFKRPVNRSDPCPCGAKNQNGDPIMWKHCHGALPGSSRP